MPRPSLEQKGWRARGVGVERTRSLDETPGVKAKVTDRRQLAQSVGRPRQIGLVVVFVYPMVNVKNAKTSLRSSTSWHGSTPYLFVNPF